MLPLFSLGFLNWLERNGPAVYGRLSLLFWMESVAMWRILHGDYNPNQLDPILDEMNAIDHSQMRQVLLFREYSPRYLRDLLVLRGISQRNIWKLNGHDK